MTAAAASVCSLTSSCCRPVHAGSNFLLDLVHAYWCQISCDIMENVQGYMSASFALDASDCAAGPFQVRQHEAFHQQTKSLLCIIMAALATPATVTFKPDRQPAPRFGFRLQSACWSAAVLEQSPGLLQGHKLGSCSLPGGHAGQQSLQAASCCMLLRADWAASSLSELAASWASSCCSRLDTAAFACRARPM